MRPCEPGQILTEASLSNVLSGAEGGRLPRLSAFVNGGLLRGGPVAAKRLLQSDWELRVSGSDHHRDGAFAVEAFRLRIDELLR